MDNCSSDPEIQRPLELLHISEFEHFIDFAVTCYFATHTRATTVSVTQLELFTSKFKVKLSDEITRVDAA